VRRKAAENVFGGLFMCPKVFTKQVLLGRASSRLIYTLGEPLQAGVVRPFERRNMSRAQKSRARERPRETSPK
jgi:hypothetical protein